MRIQALPILQLTAFISITCVKNMNIYHGFAAAATRPFRVSSTNRWISVGCV